MKNFLLLLLTITLAFSCASTSENDTPCTLGDIGITNFEEGSFHNYLVNLWMDNSISCPQNGTDFSNEYKQILINNSLQIETEFNLPIGVISDIVNELDLLPDVMDNIMNTQNAWKNYIQNANYSNTFTDKLDDLEQLFLNVPEEMIMVSDFQNLLCTFYSNNVNDLPQNEIKDFGTIIDVASKSLEYWAPDELGGINGYEDLLNSCNSNTFSNSQLDSRGIWGSIRDWAMSSAAGTFVLTDATMTVAATTAGIINSAGVGALPLCGGVPCAGLGGVVVGAGASLCTLW